jgi:hypothetical protein
MFLKRISLSEGFPDVVNFRVLGNSGVHFDGLVVKGIAMRIQYEDMRDVSLVVLLDQLLLFWRALNIKIDDHKMHLGAYLSYSSTVRRACLFEFKHPSPYMMT